MTEIASDQLEFERLFLLAGLEWPSPIDLHVTYLPRGGWLVDGLGELSDEIAERHIGSPLEVLMANLHDAIHERLHALAPEHERLTVQELSRPAVRNAFERRLLRAREAANLDWTEQDRALVQRYFEQNHARDAA